MRDTSVYINHYPFEDEYDNEEFNGEVYNPVTGEWELDDDFIDEPYDEDFANREKYADIVEEYGFEFLIILSGSLYTGVTLISTAKELISQLFQKGYTDRDICVQDAEGYCISLDEIFYQPKTPHFTIIGD